MINSYIFHILSLKSNERQLNLDRILMHQPNLLNNPIEAHHV